MSFTPQPSQLSNSNGTTDRDVVAAPGSGVVRMVKSINVHNTDTASATVTLKTDTSATEKKLVTETLAPAEWLVYEVPINIDEDTTIQIVLAGSTTTAELDVVATFGDWS